MVSSLYGRPNICITITLYTYAIYIHEHSYLPIEQPVCPVEQPVCPVEQPVSPVEQPGNLCCPFRQPDSYNPVE